MVKFSEEFRAHVVFDYLNGHVGAKKVAEKHGIKSEQTVIDWVNRYRLSGVESFEIRRPDRVYDGDFKVEVIEWMKRTGASLTRTALHFDITAVSTLHKWKKKWEEEGIEALYRQKGRPASMVSKKTNHSSKNNSESSPDLEKEVNQLKKENRLSKIENDYLKKLKALIQQKKDFEKNKPKQ